MTAVFDQTCAALARVSGDDLHVPLVQGGTCTYANFDYAASAPALAQVTDRVQRLLPYYASVHRGAGYASRISTECYEAARGSVARFLDAADDQVVVFTRNTTDSLNLLAACVPGDTVVLDVEHHANFLPWQRHGRRVVRAADTIEETVRRLVAELCSKPAALLAVTGASNVTGEVLPLARLAEIAHQCGARILVDAAQLAPHRRISLRECGDRLSGVLRAQAVRAVRRGCARRQARLARRGTAISGRWWCGARGARRRHRMGARAAAARGRIAECARCGGVGCGLRGAVGDRRRAGDRARAAAGRPLARRAERDCGCAAVAAVVRQPRRRRDRRVHAGRFRART